MAEIAKNEVKTGPLRPEDLGLPRCTLADLQGGDVNDNVQIIRDLLDGHGGPKRDIVLMNAAAALVAANHASDFKEGIRLAAQSLDSGAARKKLQALAEFTNKS